MSILNDVVLDEIKQIIKEEVSKDVNQVKLEDAKVIAQVLLPEIDRIITAKFNKFVRRVAMDVISWDLAEEKLEEPKTDDSSKEHEFEQPSI